MSTDEWKRKLFKYLILKTFFPSPPSSFVSSVSCWWKIKGRKKIIRCGKRKAKVNAIEGEREREIVIRLSNRACMMTFFSCNFPSETYFLQHTNNNENERVRGEEKKLNYVLQHHDFFFRGPKVSYQQTLTRKRDYVSEICYQLASIVHTQQKKGVFFLLLLLVSFLFPLLPSILKQRERERVKSLQLPNFTLD